mmetsp:Transcript_17067/g.29584  ORF Transcript_17067/g.29584 Transcript_17067/m.29584 type:complete len:208 (+) Transcript_17067:191-814(+)
MPPPRRSATCLCIRCLNHNDDDDDDDDDGVGQRTASPRNIDGMRPADINNTVIQQPVASPPKNDADTDDLLARFNALKPLKPKRTTSPTEFLDDQNTMPNDVETRKPDEIDSDTIDLLASFPSPKIGNTNEPSLSASALEGILPETPSGEAQDNDDDDDDGGLNLPSAPSNTLPRGIKPGSSQEKQMEKKNDLDDLAARFERLKRGY